MDDPINDTLWLYRRFVSRARSSVCLSGDKPKIINTGEPLDVLAGVKKKLPNFLLFVQPQKTWTNRATVDNKQQQTAGCRGRY